MTDNYIEKEVKTYYLQMTTPQTEEIILPKEVEIQKYLNEDINFYKEMYIAVGKKWGWTGRLIISDTELKTILLNAKDEVFIIYVNQNPAGFFEIIRHNQDETEIVYIGLKEEYIGKGYGKLLLQYAIKTAWTNTNKRIWLHTCEYDHQDAIKTYLKAGFYLYKNTIEHELYPK